MKTEEKNYLKAYLTCGAIALIMLLMCGLSVVGIVSLV